MEDLKTRFYDATSTAFVLKPQYHRAIPADGFPHFASAVWEKIASNRDLDLPTQQQLLAQYRCDELAKDIFKKFSESISVHKESLDFGRVVENLGKSLAEEYKSALDNFDSHAGRYNAEVYKSSRIEFSQKLLSSMHIYLLTQLRNLHKTCIMLFEKTCAVFYYGLIAGHGQIE